MNIEHLFNQMNSAQNDSYCYLIVDLLAGVFEHSDFAFDEIKQTYDVIVPILRPDLAYDPSLCPQLIQLAAPNEQADIYSLLGTKAYAVFEKVRKRRYIVGWLTSKLDPHKIAEHIASCCHVMGKNIRDGYTLPFFEPIRLELLNITDNHSRGWLNSMIWPIDYWGAIGSGGADYIIQGHKGNQSGYFTPQGIESQKNYNAISALLSAWNKVSHKKGQVFPEDATNQALIQINIAISQGITDLKSQILFGLNNLVK